MEQEHLMKALAQVKRIGTLLNELQDLTRQLAEALDRNDQVAAEMLIAMRQEPLERLESVRRALDDQVRDIQEKDDALRLAILLDGGAPEDDSEKLLSDQVAANGRRLKQVIELDRILNKKIAREKSIYQ